MWLLIVGLAHDLIAWTQRLLLTGELATAEPKRLRYRLLHIAARLSFHARTATLRLPASWPWLSSSPPPSSVSKRFQHQPDPAGPPATPTRPPGARAPRSLPTSRRLDPKQTISATADDALNCPTPTAVSCHLTSSPTTHITPTRARSGLGRATKPAEALPSDIKVAGPDASTSRVYCGDTMSSTGSWVRELNTRAGSGGRHHSTGSPQRGSPCPSQLRSRPQPFRTCGLADQHAAIREEQCGTVPVFGPDEPWHRPGALRTRVFPRDPGGQGAWNRVRVLQLSACLLRFLRILRRTAGQDPGRIAIPRRDESMIHAFMSLDASGVPSRSSGLVSHGCTSQCAERCL